MQTHQLDARLGKMLEELKKLSVRRAEPVEGIETALRGGRKKAFKNGDIWGQNGEWQDFFFSLSVPKGFSGRVVLRAQTGREEGWEATNPQFVVRVNGRIEQAFDTKHTELTLQTKAKSGEKFDFVLNGYVADQLPGQPPPVLRLELLDIDEPVLQLCYDMWNPYHAVLMLPEGNRERETTLETMSRALDLLDLRRPYSAEFAASVDAARKYLRKEYYDKRRDYPAIAYADCVGHTHIDVAWLWDLYQTRHKAVRSFSTVLKLMERYPEYKFMSSQAALYNMVKQDEPELYARIREAVKAGRWEVEGGMWVEADCNLASGESLVRQFLLGQEFFQKEFGKLSRILWLPDVFGYSAALPQIMKLSGIDYFMTSKLSWSEFNLSPYDTFNWKGIDGSEVLTHFTPTRDYTETNETGHAGLAHFTTYNAMITPEQMAGGWQRFQQKGLDDEFLVTFGYGDGGGGPTDWMLENGRRMQTPLPGVPVVRQTHARPFFEELEKRVAENPRLPKWSGELYLEYHRGTYTAMARNKRSNRKIEFALREAELWSAYAERIAGQSYPAEQLQAIWEDVLTLQFHDILPGSSIQKVYDDSKEMYARRGAEAGKLTDTAMKALAKKSPGDIVAFNSLSHERDDIVWFDAPDDITGVKNERGEVFPVQFVEGRACAFVRGLSPMSPNPLWFTRDKIKGSKPVKAAKSGFETPFFKGKFDKAMRISSLVEKQSGREIAKKGEKLNRIVCYENKPHNYDAWDINIYYDRRHWEVDDVRGVKLVSSGPVLALLRVDYAYMDSVVSQDICLYNDIGRIDFQTTVDWKEKQYLLKAHFPVDVFYNEATFDIQYGNLKRPTHKNTSWDIARFEVCGHKWADVGEDGFGVSLLNDCKYGYSVDENSMALTLLKSSVMPNPIADQEEHAFTYSLMPHAGGWRDAGTAEMAYQLNVPVTVMKGGGKKQALASFAASLSPNICIEAVKKAQDGNGYILRAYECYGSRTEAVIFLDAAPEKAEICDLLERGTGAAELEENSITATFHPYEIKSFRIMY